MATFLVAFLGGVVGLASGALAGAFAGTFIAAATRMSTFEGAAGYFAVFVCAPIGAVIGLLLGVWLALRLRGGSRSLAAVVGYSGLTLGTVVAGAAAVIALVLLFDETLNRNPGKAPGPVRNPTSAGQQARRRSPRHRSRARRRPEWSVGLLPPGMAARRRPAGGCLGGVELAFRTTQRILVLKIKGEPDRLFRLELSGKPVHSDEFGAWQHVDFVADGSHRAAPGDRRRSVRHPLSLARSECRVQPADHRVRAQPAGGDRVADRPRVHRRGGAGGAEPRWRGRSTPTRSSARTGGSRWPEPSSLAGDTHSLLAITLPDQPTRLFEVTLPPLTWITETIRHATTSPADDRRTFGPWQHVALVREVGRKQARPARPEDDAQLRYMLR